MGRSDDPKEVPEIDASGQPLPDEVTVQDLDKGLEYEVDDQLPEEEHAAHHPTPDHPTGRLTP